MAEDTISGSSVSISDSLHSASDKDDNKLTCTINVSDLRDPEYDADVSFNQSHWISLTRAMKPS